MDLMLFTVEEENLICIYDTSNCAALIQNINDALPHFEEPELYDIAISTLHKLKKLTDAEFSELIFHPAYHGDEDINGEG